MTIELLQSNIAREKELVQELNIFSDQLSHMQQLETRGARVSREEKNLIQKSITSLVTQIKIINAAIPEIINNIGFYKELPDKHARNQPKNILQIKYKHPEKGEISVAIPKSKQKKFVESVTSEDQTAKLKGKIKTSSSLPKPKKPSAYIKYSNKYFRDYSSNLVKKGYFDKLNKELRKITSPLMVTSYVSIMLLSTVLSFFAGILIMTIFFIAGINPLIAIATLFVVPIVTFLMFFSYPSSESKRLEKEINQELPFVTIYMSAIATSGIEPSKIFSILVATKDYPFTQREVKKLLNYINFYGYDLVSALKYVAKNNPSARLAMLFNGMSTTVTTGGRLTDFLEKHSETLLFDYRLEREKYTKIAETFMDIYISVVIAAPMILMMLFVLLSLTGFLKIPALLLSMIVVLIVSMLNVLFLIFINMRQPKF